MRKDVKFGLTIGAVLVATLVVYVIVLSRGSSAPPKIGLVMPGPMDQSAQPGDSTPMPSGANPSHDGGNANTDQQDAAGAPSGTDSNSAIPTASDTSGATTQPTATADAKSDWDGALNRGLPPSLSASATPERTVTPMIDSPPSDVARGQGGVSRAANTPVIDPLPTTQPGQQLASNGLMLDAALAGPIPTPSNVAPAGSPRTHRVAAGESPYSIAQAVYGNAKYYKKILAANPGLDAHHLKIGQVLTIPDLSDTERNPAAAASAADGSASVDPTTAYTVRPGDSLESISRKLYGGPGMIDKLYAMNKLMIGPDENVLKVGWVLKLPEAPTAGNSGR